VIFPVSPDRLRGVLGWHLMGALERARTNMKTKPTPTPAIGPEPWLDTAATCDHLAISKPTLYRWVKAGRITPRRTPTGELRFRRSELDAILA